MGRRSGSLRPAPRPAPAVGQQVGHTQLGGDVERLRDPVAGHHLEQRRGRWNSTRIGRYILRHMHPLNCRRPYQPNATLQARGIASARASLPLFPVALQALVRGFSRANEEIRWDAQVLSQLLNLWE
jgi:hypothetical protein